MFVFNLRFSGVTEEDLKNTTTTIRDVQAILLNLFSAATILIGHSLESDLYAVKVRHAGISSVKQGLQDCWKLVLFLTSILGVFKKRIYYSVYYSPVKNQPKKCTSTFSD